MCVALIIIFEIRNFYEVKCNMYFYRNITCVTGLFEIGKNILSILQLSRTHCCLDSVADIKKNMRLKNESCKKFQQ